MKPIFIRLLAFLLPLTMALSANSQTRIHSLAFSKTVLDSAAKNLIRMEMEAAADNDRKMLAGIQTSSPQLHHNFTTKFKDAYEITMEIRKNVYISCLVNGIRNRSLYTKSGRLLHNIRYYDITALPEAVKETVNHNYPAFRIFGGVTEVEVRGETVYFVLIEDLKTWKRVQVAGDAIEVYESYSKAPNGDLADNDY